MMYITGYARTHRGKVRPINEDNLCINRRFKEKDAEQYMCAFREKHDSLIGVFDGIGGEDCGEMASFIAAKTMARFDGHLPDNNWEMLLGDINHRINQFARDNHPCSLGSTAAIVSIQGDTVQACNLGDSRIYHYADGRLKRISKDHTELQQALDMKLENLEDRGIRKNCLTGFLGIQARELNPFVVPDVPLGPGSFLLLCSDGLTDMVSEEAIAQAMSAGDCKTIVDRLMDQALANGGRDNITIILLTGEKKSSWLSRLLR